MRSRGMSRCDSRHNRNRRLSSASAPRIPSSKGTAMNHRSLSISLAIVVATVMAALAQATATIDVPTFRWDPAWPKAMPNNWMLGATIGAYVDSRDHIWIVHRSFGNGTGAPTDYQIAAAQKPPTAECCVPAPPVVEFDQAGSVV